MPDEITAMNERITKLETQVNGNGRPGLVERMIRMEQLLATRGSAFNVIMALVSAITAIAACIVALVK